MTGESIDDYRNEKNELCSKCNPDRFAGIIERRWRSMIRIKLPRVRAIDSEQLIIFAYCLLVVISILNTTQFGDIMGYHLIVRGIKYLCMALVFFAFWMRKNISPKTF